MPHDPIPSRPATQDARRRWRHAARIATVAAVGFAVLAGCTSRPPTGGGSGRYRGQVFSTLDKVSNVAYSSAQGRTGMQTLRLDVYKPRGDTVTKRPLIIFAYAGGFSFGDKSNTGDPAHVMSQYYARRGYVTAMINYRMLATGGCTGVNSSNSCRNAAIAGIFDGLAAVRYLRANAETYGIDPDRVAFGGDSAGGVIAAGVGLMSQIAVDQMPAGQANTSTPNVSGKVQAFMALSGGLPDATYADPGDGAGILFAGSADFIVPASHSRIVVDGLQAVGVDAKLVMFQGAGHVPWQYRSTILDQTTDWFYEHLDLANAAR